jgi:hypothetical protein
MKRKPKDPEQPGPHYARTLSEVLGEFVGEIAPEDANDEEFEQSVRMAVILWNLALLPAEQQGETLWRMQEQATGGHDPMFTARLHELFDLRRGRFGSDRRLVMDCRIEVGTKGRRLVVASFDPDRPEKKTAQ